MGRSADKASLEGSKDRLERVAASGTLGARVVVGGKAAALPYGERWVSGLQSMESWGELWGECR